MSDKREWTAERHAAATARCDAATKGPWATYDGGWREHARAAVNPWRFMFVVVPLDGPPKYPGHVASKFVAELKDAQDAGALRAEADAAFIAAARVDLPDALAEIERLSRSEAACVREALEQVGGARAERDEARAERDLMRAGRRRAAQTLIAEIGAAGPEDIEETAKRAVKEIRRLKADLLLLGALKSEEVAPVIERFRAAFGADVPQAPSGKRTTAEVERDAWERLRAAATAAVEAYENSDADEAFEPVFEAIDDALAGLATFEEESGDEPFAAAAPVRHARHDRHCMIHDGVGCSREPGCEVDG